MKIYYQSRRLKATPVGDIHTDMLNQTTDIHLPIMTQIINMSIDNNCYPDDLKLAQVFEKITTLRTV